MENQISQKEKIAALSKKIEFGLKKKGFDCSVEHYEEYYYPDTENPFAFGFYLCMEEYPNPRYVAGQDKNYSKMSRRKFLTVQMDIEELDEIYSWNFNRIFRYKILYVEKFPQTDEYMDKQLRNQPTKKYQKDIFTERKRLRICRNLANTLKPLPIKYYFRENSYYQDEGLNLEFYFETYENHIFLIKFQTLLNNTPKKSENLIFEIFYKNFLESKKICTYEEFRRNPEFFINQAKVIDY